MNNKLLFISGSQVIMLFIYENTIKDNVAQPVDFFAQYEQVIVPIESANDLTPTTLEKPFLFYHTAIL